MNINFVNPYNFVPLHNKKSEAPKEGTLSGVIEYSLLTKTPLFIPNTSSDRAFNDMLMSKYTKNEDVKEVLNPEKTEEYHKSFEFYSYEDLEGKTDRTGEELVVPVIPGSSIRGMFRSNYEILTNSCMSVLNDESLSKRTSQTFQPGLLQKKGEDYYLYQARDYLVRTEGANSLVDDFGNPRDYRKINRGNRTFYQTSWTNNRNYYLRECFVQKKLEGKKVYFTPITRSGRGVKPLATDVSTTPDLAKEVGYFLGGEKGPQTNTKQQKHCGHVFQLTGGNPKGKVDISFLNKALILYEKNGGKNYYKQYKDAFDNLKNSKVDYLPVYYSELPNGSILLSPACITREISTHRINDLTKNHNPCRGNGSCPACHLFGTIETDPTETSRIRFTDLTIKENKGFYAPLTLSELSEPKINNIEFYIERPSDQAWFWTFDYYVNNQGNSQMIITPSLNGRKFYWHNLEMEMPDNISPTNRNITIRPLKEESKFKGRIYFDNLSAAELNTLVYLVNAGDNNEFLEEKERGYKLGAAKPLGFGSVAVQVDAVFVRKMDLSENGFEWKETDYHCSEEVLFIDEWQQEFLTMTDFYPVKDKKRIHYPVLDETVSVEEQDIFEWFTENHKPVNRDRNGLGGMTNTRNNMHYQFYLKPLKTSLQATSFLSEGVEEEHAENVIE